VRKVVLEENIPIDSDKVKALRERLFGNWEMNWVGFNYARDFTLPEQKHGPIGFLMYPYAETADSSKDSLDSETFHSLHDHVKRDRVTPRARRHRRYAAFLSGGSSISD
jgi:hypothetical protein